MKRISILLLLVLNAVTALAQSDLCWRDPYPWIPGEWAGSGSIVEAGNRFQAVPGALVELWSTTYKYDDARQHAIRHQVFPASLVETAQSDAQGVFVLTRLRRSNEAQPGSYEIRVRMPGRESSLAYVQIGGPGPQWIGRGIKVALSEEDKGCSRIYSAGLDDTDCGVLDCEKLPAGRAKIVYLMEPRWRTIGLTFINTAKREGRIQNFR